FRIAAHRGLAPQIVQSVRLPAGEGLPRWLASQGRPLALHDVSDPDLVRELKLLQGVVATPLLAHGDLVAILVLGQPVFGAGYSRAEIETLFDLVTQLATVIRDIALHQQLERETEFTERILSHMSSGVVTIGRDQRVGMMNRRAEEILGLSAHAVVHQDLRVLPSPLGDLLFDTLSSGRAMPRTEIQLALRRLWIEVTTYVIRDEESAPLGAVLVFEDLTAQKELAAQKREADQFQLLTRVVARIADEIKNPLVSINTFIELIGERYDDPDFRRHFSSVVRRDVRRLVEVFEKLAGLVTEGELNFAIVDAREVGGQLVDAIDVADEAAGRHLHLDVVPEPAPQHVADRLVDAIDDHPRLSQPRHKLESVVPLTALPRQPRPGRSGLRASWSWTTRWDRASRSACCSSRPTRSRPPTVARSRWRRSRPTGPTSSSSTSRCRRSTGWRSCAASSASTPRSRS